MTEIILKSELTYLTDISWIYEYRSSDYLIKFGQSGLGTNKVYEFKKNINGIFVSLIPTDTQLNLMFKILNETPYQ